MPRLLKYFLKGLEVAFICAVIVGVLSTLQLISNARFVSAVSKFIKSEVQAKKLIDVNAANQTLNDLRVRTDTYVNLIEDTHLESGMIVNRIFNGNLVDECDSLLFSALYFVALKHLHKDDLAAERWRSMELSQTDGHWYRHPHCLTTPPSRDMIIGVLIALSQEPASFKKHLSDFFTQLETRGGYFSDGSLSVSYLSPGVAEIIRKFSLLHGLRAQELPASVRSGFSTTELSVALTRPGYRLHLSALQSWLEMELNKKLSPVKVKSRTAVNNVRRLTRPFIIRALHEQRLEYVTQVLVERSPHNLFFKFLRFQAANALSPAIVITMMNELLAMPQFPTDRLPNDCDRKADYLWQRSDDEQVSARNTCKRIFSGVDFVWMSALLQNALELSAQAP